MATATPRATRSTSDASREPHRLAERFGAVRAATLALAAPLSAEDCALQSMPDASPVKWHLGHTTWFFETFVLERFEPTWQALVPEFRVLFNSYYNAVGDKHPRAQRGLLSRPSLADVIAYRHRVEHAMRVLLDRGGEHAERDALIELGIQHEQQHQELVLTDLKHLFACNPLEPAYQKQWPLTPVQRQQPGWLDYPGGLAPIGHEGPGFAFDNESPRHAAFVAPFRLATHPVTNGEFLAFVEDGGYRRPDLWLSLGWDVAQAQRWTAPLYWRAQATGYSTFTLHGRAALDPAAPVAHVSYFEADAYARWAGARLPTEEEWEHAAGDVPIAGNFQESGAFHPLAPRALGPAGAPTQLYGDVWEWTRSAYSPYPGFRAASGAVGEYNGKFMCNQYVLRGGSCATPQSHIRRTYRNFFAPDARWQFSGIRLARDAA